MLESDGWVHSRLRPAGRRPAAAGSSGPVAEAFRSRRSDVVLEDAGTVVKTLPDDNVGSRHQRFIVDMPGGEMENSGPYTTWGFMIGVSAQPDMPDDVAYNIVKAVMEDDVEQATAFPAVAGANLAELTLQYATSPLHPGAIRYFEEIGLTVPDNLR